MKGHRFSKILSPKCSKLDSCVYKTLNKLSYEFVKIGKVMRPVFLRYYLWLTFSICKKLSVNLTNFFFAPTDKILHFPCHYNAPQNKVSKHFHDSASKIERFHWKFVMQKFSLFHFFYSLNFIFIFRISNFPTLWRKTQKNKTQTQILCLAVTHIFVAQLKGLVYVRFNKRIITISFCMCTLSKGIYAW